MRSPSWSEQLSAWSTFATAALTLLIVIMALLAWRTAKATLEASKKASDAATVSAAAARAANEQAIRDSIEQTRPYVYAEILPGLSGTSAWDLKITNVGKSSARGLSLSRDEWPDASDEVTTALRELFETPRTLPPGCSIRALWRIEGPFVEGGPDMGLGRRGHISVSYTSDDPASPSYQDRFDVMIDKAGLWPVGESGPNAQGLTDDSRAFYALGQAMVRRISELAR